MAYDLTVSYQKWKPEALFVININNQERFAHPHVRHGRHNQLYGKLCSQTGNIWSSPFELNVNLYSIWLNRGPWKEKSNLRSLECPAATGYTTLLVQGAVSDQQFSASSCGLLAPTWPCSQCSAYITRWAWDLIVYTLMAKINSSFVFMQPACLEVLWKLAWVSFENITKCYTLL